MAEHKWTPGPWCVKYEGGDTKLVMGDGRIHMCDMCYYPWVPENDADWHLIAAAPDLYEALEDMVDVVEYFMGLGVPNKETSEARAALAKARGKQ